MNKLSSFYLVSTPLHLLVAIAVALSKRDVETPVLIFVAQEADNQRMDFFRKSMTQWSDSPFVEVVSFFRPEGKFFSKFNHRKKVFAELACLIDKRTPDVIYVGNDRQFEFQWAMHYSRQLKSFVKGIYLDEGLYSYLGRKASKRFSERVVDNALKKWTYGSWYQSPPTIGGSVYVDQVMVAFPDFVFEELKQRKTVVSFPDGVFEQSGLIDLARRWLEDFKIDAQALSESTVVVTLPEQSDMQQIDGYFDKARDLVMKMAALNQKIIIKYHPKDLNQDLLSVADLEGVMMVPANAPFEILLQSLQPNTLVLGDMSSTMLTAKLFRADLSVIVMQLGSESSCFGQFLELFNKLDLPLMNPEAILNLIKMESSHNIRTDHAS